MGSTTPREGKARSSGRSSRKFLLRKQTEETGLTEASDGLHLETKGYQVFWDQYTDLVRTTFKGRGLSFTDLSDLPLRVPE